MLTIVKPGWELLYPNDLSVLPAFIERCGRCCYKSEDRITEDSADKFVRRICRNNHESVLEHASITVKIVCSRAASHQLVRHRIGSYSQESMRYCNYGKMGLQVVAPEGMSLKPGPYRSRPRFLGMLPIWEWHNLLDDVFEKVEHNTQAEWLDGVYNAYKVYLSQIERGAKPEDARFILPNATKTEVVTTYNIRMWRHIIRTRCSKHAQWEIRGIFRSIFDEFVKEMPAFFEDLIDEI